MNIKLKILVSLLLVASSLCSWLSSSEYVNPNVNPNDPFDYGVDVTSPINYPLKGDTVFKRRYDNLMAGCYKAYSRVECDATELSRMEMNMQQTSTQHNYTEMGFKKIRVPKLAWDALSEFYNKNKDKEKLEKWNRGNTYVNHWDAPSTMISFEDRSLRGGIDVKQVIWDNIQPIIEEWVGRRVKPTSMYGIRSYKTGSILATRESLAHLTHTHSHSLIPGYHPDLNSSLCHPSSYLLLSFIQWFWSLVKK